MAATYDHDAATARRIAAAIREHPDQVPAFYAARLGLSPAVVALLIERYALRASISMV